MMAHVAAIVAATDLPVSADLENGFGDDPATVAPNDSAAAAAGVAGGSIEDATRGARRSNLRDRARTPIACAPPRTPRVRGLLPFMLTARAENYLRRPADLADTIARLQAYQDAGADVLYAPGLTAGRHRHRRPLGRSPRQRAHGSPGRAN